LKIFIDIGHPAHVHYFKNFIKKMEANGHTFFVSARERSIIFELLTRYKILYFNRGKGRDGVFGKIFYMFAADFKLVFKALKFKPQIFLSFASPYAAQTAWLLKKPHIVLDDTEHARFGHLFYKPFSNVFLNPSCFRKDFGKRQIRFKGYSELFYLHPNNIAQNPQISALPGISENEKFALLRFVSWKANHDIGHFGLDFQTKTKLISILLEKHYKVFISSEAENKDPFFDKYIIRISPDHIHEIMDRAQFLVTEGATMASECAMMGTPAIYVNSLDAGTLREQEDKYQLIHGFRSSAGVLEKVTELINTPDLKNTYKLRRDKMLADKIDPTAFLVWFVENYPASFKIMKENPDYQDRFR
jgi:predicted glycosyltransferase